MEIIIYSVIGLLILANLIALFTTKSGWFKTEKELKMDNILCKLLSDAISENPKLTESERSLLNFEWTQLYFK